MLYLFFDTLLNQEADLVEEIEKKYHCLINELQEETFTGWMSG